MTKYMYLELKRKRKGYHIDITNANNPDVMKLIRNKKICYYSQIAEDKYINLLLELKSKFNFYSEKDFVGKESHILNFIYNY